MGLAWLVGWVFLGCSSGGGDPEEKPDDPLLERVRGDLQERRDRRGMDDEPDEDIEGAQRRRPKGTFEPVADPCAGFGDGGLYTFTHEFEGTRYDSLLYVPPGKGPFDLVVVLHGGSGTPAKSLAQTRFDEGGIGEPRPVVLAPSAAPLLDHGNHWNSGNYPDHEKHGRDDVAYLESLTEAVRKQVCARRVLAAGFSNGGQMAMRWGCQGKQPDAVLTAAGRLLVPPSSCTARPMKGYIGTLDPVYDRTPNGEGPEQRSVLESFATWAKINGCADRPSERPDREARCRTWEGCAAPTELCIIDGLHHAWPSPWNRKKPTQTNASVDGMNWFRQLAKDGGDDGQQDDPPGGDRPERGRKGRR